MSSSCDISLCGFKTLCLYLAISWFGRVYIAMEKSHRKVLGRNHYEQISKNGFQIPSDESNTELYTVMSCIFLCFYVSVSSCCVFVYVLTYVNECFIGKEFSYNENGKFQYMLSTLMRKNKWPGQPEEFHIIVFLL